MSRRRVKNAWDYPPDPIHDYPSKIMRDRNLSKVIPPFHGWKKTYVVRKYNQTKGKFH
jgi:hypothetical protein